MKFGGRSAVQHHFLIAGALGLLFLVVMISGIYATYTATNAVEHQRSAQLVDAAIQSQKAVLGGFAEDNAWWDEAAIEIYTNNNELPVFQKNWGIYTNGNAAYSLVAMLDEDQNIIAATENGRSTSFNVRKKYGDSVANMIANLTLSTPSDQDIVKENGEISVVAASIIRHTDDQKSLGLLKKKKRILVLKQILSDEVIDEISSQYNIPGLRFSDTRTEKFGLPLKDKSGRALGQFTWSPPTTGYSSVRDSLPVLAVGGILFFIALSLSFRMTGGLFKSLSMQAFTDSLSGMPNRRALNRAIQSEQTRSNAHALALIDLDGFKHVNDRYGHAAGDQLIKHVAQMLKKLTAGVATVARLGGDEFAILVTSSDPKPQIERMALQLLQNLVDPIMVDGHCLAIGASIGLAETSTPLNDEGELLRRADIAMYQAKKHGKMQMRWYNEQLDDGQSEKEALAAELRSALNNDELAVVYQPIVESRTHRCVSVEALVRWHSPTKGFIPPKIFVPIAENTGLIDAVGSFVLRRACRDLADHEEIGLAVNISSAQLRNPHFSRELKDILKEASFAPSRLELEITETHLIADERLARKVIEEVIALGVAVTLDDFGTGYASIGFLRQFPFGKLKIDRSLVKEAQYDEAARMLVKVSIAAARTLKMKVTAEGVETIAESESMQAAGCDHLQGWYFGKPVVHSELEAMFGQDAVTTASAA